MAAHGLCWCMRWSKDTFAGPDGESPILRLHVTSNRSDMQLECSICLELNFRRAEFQEAMAFHGVFSKIREVCDYSYHVNYTPERQNWQDQATVAKAKPFKLDWGLGGLAPILWMDEDELVWGFK